MKFQQLLTPFYALNNSKFFAGLVMLILNIGSKHITIELSNTQKEYLHNSIGRQLLIFSISWLGTRDIFYALALTAIFTVLTEYLFNENSSFCILPKKMRILKNVIDTNADGLVSEQELKNAINVLEKAKKQKQKELQIMYTIENFSNL